MRRTLTETDRDLLARHAPGGQGPGSTIPSALKRNTGIRVTMGVQPYRPEPELLPGPADATPHQLARKDQR